MSFIGRSRDQSSGAPYARIPTSGTTNAPPVPNRAGQHPPSIRAVHHEREQYTDSGYSGDRTNLPLRFVCMSAVTHWLTTHSSFSVAQCPSNSLALSNRLIFHPLCGLREGEHVLVKDQFPLTVKLVYSESSMKRTILI